MRSVLKRIKWEWKQRRGWTRKNIPKRLRKQVFDEKGTDCTYCGKPDVRALDHLKPVSLGGENTFENLVPSCDSCNSAKGSQLQFRPIT